MPFAVTVPSTVAELDLALSAQLIVAWAGESAPDDPRLAWWDTDLATEYGGEDFFRRLLPDTWRWAIFRSLREAARRADTAARLKDADPDRIFSLFHFGFELDERLEERLADLERSTPDPSEALPVLSSVIAPAWSLDRFEAWSREARRPDTETTSVGRRLRGTAPPSLGQLIPQLTSALTPIAAAYPLPHYRLA